MNMIEALRAKRKIVIGNAIMKTRREYGRTMIAVSNFNKACDLTMAAVSMTKANKLHLEAQALEVIYDNY